MKQNSLDENYLKLVERIKNEGIEKSDRTGTGTISLFGTSLRHKMSEGFPLLTSKQMSVKSIAAELIWFLKGSTDIRELWAMGCNIWDGDWYKKYCSTTNSPYSLEQMRGYGLDSINSAFSQGFHESTWSLGPIYGKQWRDFNGVDQIKNLINDIKTNPDSRRLMVSAWNPSDLDKMTLPPCHYGFQCYTEKLDLEERQRMLAHQTIIFDSETTFTEEECDKANIPSRKLSLMWNQRSVDTLLGLPYNLASYGFLLMILCRETNCVPDEIIVNMGDTHIYLNQLPFVEQQLQNETFNLPAGGLYDYRGLNDLTIDKFKVFNYKHGGKVQYPLSN